MKRLIAMLKNNLWLKVWALVFAVILWTYVMTQVDPYRNRTISEVPIRYNLRDLEDKKLQLRGDTDEIFPDVEVVVSIKLSNFSDLGKNNITVTADLSSISSSGEHVLELKCESTLGKVVSVSPSTVTLDVDNLIKKNVPVVGKKTGEMPDGLVDGELTISPKEVMLYGPQRDLELAERAVFEIDLSKVTEDIDRSFNLKVLDKDDNELPAAIFVDEVPSVNVKMEVLHKKTVPIIYDKSSLTDLNSLPEGYVISDVKLLPADTAEIKGREDDLAQIESLDVQPISIEGLDPENPSEIPVKLILPDGISLVSPVTYRAQVIVEKLPEETEDGEEESVAAAVYMAAGQAGSIGP